MAHIVSYINSIHDDIQKGVVFNYMYMTWNGGGKINDTVQDIWGFKN